MELVIRPSSVFQKLDRIHMIEEDNVTMIYTKTEETV